MDDEDVKDAMNEVRVVSVLVVCISVNISA